MKITYDPKADVATVYLGDGQRIASRGHSVGIDPTEAAGAMVFVHFDGEGRVTSIKILGASNRVDAAVLAVAPMPDVSDFWDNRAVYPPRARPPESE